MGKSTISMAMASIATLNYQRVHIAHEVYRTRQAAIRHAAARECLELQSQTSWLVMIIASSQGFTTTRWILAAKFSYSKFFGGSKLRMLNIQQNRMMLRIATLPAWLPMASYGQIKSLGIEVVPLPGTKSRRTPKPCDGLDLKTLQTRTPIVSWADFGPQNEIGCQISSVASHIWNPISLSIIYISTFEIMSIDCRESNIKCSSHDIAMFDGCNIRFWHVHYFIHQ